MAISSLNASISPYLNYGGKLQNPRQALLLSSEWSKRRRSSDTISFRSDDRVRVSCFKLNPPDIIDKPILKEALKEPVAFMGGLVAGLLRLDLNEEPLKEWVTRNVEASGISQDIDPQGFDAQEEIPQQIEIE